MWNAPIRARPQTESKWAMTFAALAVVVMSQPAAVTWQVSKQNPTRSGSATRSRISARCPKS